MDWLADPGNPRTKVANTGNELWLFVEVAGGLGVLRPLRPEPGYRAT
jgi:hypothetical protein